MVTREENVPQRSVLIQNSAPETQANNPPAYTEVVIDPPAYDEIFKCHGSDVSNLFANILYFIWTFAFKKILCCLIFCYYTRV